MYAFLLSPRATCPEACPECFKAPQSSILVSGNRAGFPWRTAGTFWALALVWRWLAMRSVSAPRLSDVAASSTKSRAVIAGSPPFVQPEALLSSLQFGQTGSVLGATITIQEGSWPSLCVGGGCPACSHLNLTLLDSAESGNSSSAGRTTPRKAMGGGNVAWNRGRPCCRGINQSRRMLHQIDFPAHPRSCVSSPLPFAVFPGSLTYLSKRSRTLSNI